MPAHRQRSLPHPRLANRIHRRLSRNGAKSRPNEAWGNLVKILRPITAVAASAALIVLLPASSALAQRQPPSPEQRIQRLERQVDEMQRRVFPKGRPADTAGYSDDPAATQSKT